MNDEDKKNSASSPARKNRNTLIALVSIALGMLCLAYAFVPLYSLFCKVTGFGGTTQVASDAANLEIKIGSKTIKVRFDGNVNSKLPWKFYPTQNSITVKTGQKALAFYKAKNLSSKAVTGIATYNVTPENAGIYFNKIECFCFVQQTLKAGQEVEMPLLFFIDPEIENDKLLRSTDTITLSYSFFKSEND